MTQFSNDDPFGAFPEQVREDVHGLMWLGYLEDSFSFCGHDFMIRTLRGDEDLQVGVLAKEFMETTSQAKAQVWATIALAIEAVDGDPNFCPQAGPDRRSYARGRFQYATQTWYWPLAVYVFDRYSRLLERQAEALRAIEDLLSGSLPTPTPYADSSIDRASLEDAAPEEPLEDIREYLDPEDGSTPSNSDS